MRSWITAMVALWALPSWAEVQLSSPNGTPYVFQDTAGGALTGPAAFSTWPELCVRACVNCDSACEVPEIYDAAGAASTPELNGLQRATAPVALAGLEVRRRIFVPNAGQSLADGFIRYLDTFHNPGAEPVTVAVRFGTVRAGRGINPDAAQVWRTAGRDANLLPVNRWFLTDDNDAQGGAAAVAYLVHGAGARILPARMAQRFPVDEPGALAWEYRNLTVPAGETYALLSVIVHETGRLAVLEEVTNLLRVRDVEVLFGLNDDQRRQILNFDVDPANGAPLSDAGGPYTVNEGAQVQLNAQGSFDPEFQPLTYEWDLDNNGDFDDAVGQNVITSFAQDGNYTVRLRVTDPGGKIDIDAAPVTVRNVDPRIDGIVTDSPIDEGSFLNVRVIATDPGVLDVLTYDFDWDGDGDFEDLGNETNEVRHRYFQDGNYTASVRVQDGRGGQAISTFDVEVRNVAPTIFTVAVPPQVLEGAEFEVQVVAQDPGNDDMTFYYDLDDDGVYEIVGLALDRVNAQFRNDGLFRVNVRVCDDQDACSDRSATVNVLNARPAIDSIVHPSPVSEGEAFELSVVASDPGLDDVLFYAFDLNNNGTFDVADQLEPRTTVRFNQQGRYTIRVRVRDEDGGVTHGETTVEVLNAPPVAVVHAPASAEQGEQFTVRCEASDPGDDVLTYDWDLTGDGNFDVFGTAETEQQTSFRSTGFFTIRCRVSDGDGGVIFAEAVVRIGGVPPVWESLEVTSPIDEGGEAVVRAIARHPGVDSLLFDFDFEGDGSWDIADRPGQRDGELVTAIGRRVYRQDGEYTVRVRVRDGALDPGSIQEAPIFVNNVAPTLSLESNSPVDEGEALVITAEVSDPGDDVITLRWDLDGDGEWDEETLADEPGGLERTLQTRDNLRYAVSVWADDGDGGVTLAQLVVEARNVAPTLLPVEEIPVAVESQLFELEMPASDPGADDVLTWSLINPPAHAEIDAATGTLRWTPTYDHFLASPIDLTIEVADDDGGRDRTTILVTVLPLDLDADGLPDTYERNTCSDDGQCLDPTNPDDALEDPDGDGRDSLTEYRERTDPWVYEGPSTPVHLAPADASRPATEQPTLRVGPISNVLADPNFVVFAIYADAALNTEVAISEPLPAAQGQEVSWIAPPGTLHEDQTYHWRARAEGGAAVTPWTQPWSLQINAINEAPLAPIPRAPLDGATVDTRRPALEVLPSIDPDGDPLRYVFRIYRSPEPDAAVETSGNGVVLDGFVQFIPSIDLADNRTYSWDAVAVDQPSVGDVATSPPSERWRFTVDTTNDAPSTPTIYAPEDGTLVDSRRPHCEAGDSLDNDDPIVSYVFSVYPKGAPEAALTSDPIEQDVNNRATWIPPEPLDEDMDYVLEVYATDGVTVSDKTARVEFFVSEVDDPPSVPQPTSPGNGATVSANQVTMIWTDSVDPEGGTVTYEVEYCVNGADCTTSEPRERTGLSLPRDRVVSSAEYSWRVRALDPAANASEWSETFTFKVQQTSRGGGGDDGCGCRADSGGGELPWALALLTGLALTRRRRMRATGG